MTIEELRELIATGEKIDVELKRSRNDITKDVYDSVASFNNRSGGHIFLGVLDNKEILGVKPEAIDKMLKDFTTA
ncbi:MAG: putative DNA binding domain-containing protein, partial [Lachnospiraceae bacterium]